MVLNSAVNFYGPDITEADVDAYYAKIMKKGDKKPVSYGLNSKLVRKNGKVVEEVYKVVVALLSHPDVLCEFT